MKAITLANLADSTPQEVFDWVAYNLLKQNRKSLQASDSSNCAYRSYDGLKCAAGWCISDDEWKAMTDKYESDPEREKLTKTYGVNDTIQTRSWTWFAERTGYIPRNHHNLIRSLQAVHDNNHPNQWKDKLSTIAELFSLSKDILNQQTT